MRLRDAEKTVTDAHGVLDMLTSHNKYKYASISTHLYPPSYIHCVSCSPNRLYGDALKRQPHPSVRYSPRERFHPCSEGRAEFYNRVVMSVSVVDYKGW